MIFPLAGITTTSPGSAELAGGETNEPSGRRSVSCFDGWGKVKVKVSGVVVLIEYGQTRACVFVRVSA